MNKITFIFHLSLNHAFAMIYFIQFVYHKKDVNKIYTTISKKIPLREKVNPIKVSKNSFLKVKELKPKIHIQSMPNYFL